MIVTFPVNISSYLLFFKLLDSRRNRPMSTVLLPISPVEGDQEIESDNESDWGSDFDESETNDQDENEDELYEIVGDMSKRNTSNVSCTVCRLLFQ